jgi:hypothetical protein
MPYIVLANKLAFQKTKPDNPTVPDGPEELVSRGSNVPDYVLTFQVAALAAAGQIVWANRPDPVLVPVDSQPPTGRTPDQPAVLPSDPNGTPVVLEDVLSDPATTPEAPGPAVNDPATGPATPLPELPKAADNKDTWEQYSTLPQIGMTLGEAEAMNKTDLMAEVKTRHARATA